MLFKILHGDKSRISTDITPYHEGYCYVTHDGDFYVDMNNERVKLNAKDAETLTGMSYNDIKTYIDNAVSGKADADHTHEEFNQFLEDVLSAEIYTADTTSNAFTYEGRQFYYVGTLSDDFYNSTIVAKYKIKVTTSSSTIRDVKLGFSHYKMLGDPYYNTYFTEINYSTVYMNNTDRDFQIQFALDSANKLYMHHNLSSSLVTLMSIKKILGIAIAEDSIPDTIARTTYVDEQLTTKADSAHNHDNSYYSKSDGEALAASLDLKLDSTALNNYYTKTQIDNLELITTAEIDAICSATTGVQVVTLNEGVF